MARTFNGTSDKGTVTLGTTTGDITNVIPGTTGSTVRRSHPKPFVLAGGNLLLGYCTNEDFAAGSSSFYYKCKVSTDNGANWGAAVTISSTSATFEGAFAQLSGGTLVCVYGPNSNVCYKTSTDGGANWSAETVITTGSGGDPHPDCILNGTTLTVVYTNGGAVVRKQATVTSTTVGAFGAEGTVAAGTTLANPSIRKVNSGELLVAYHDTTANGAARLVRSTDSGVGSAWSALSNPNNLVPTSGGANDPNLLIDGTNVWLIQTVGTDTTGSYPSVVAGQRQTYAQQSTDSGTTWSPAGVLYGLVSTDFHRINGVMIGGVPYLYGAAIDGDTDYHIDRMAPHATPLANLRAGLAPTPVLGWTTATFWGWIQVSSATNAADTLYLLSTSVAGSVDWIFGQMYPMATAATRELHFYVGYSTVLDYKCVGQVADNVWTFVAATVNLAAGAGAKVQWYVGTTPSNLAAVTTSVVTEPSGAKPDDTPGPIVIGGRSLDNARNWVGSAGKLGMYPGVLTLPQLKGIMRGAFPAGTAAIWPLAKTDTSTDTDASEFGNTVNWSGTTAAATDPPTFSNPYMALLGVGA